MKKPIHDMVSQIHESLNQSEIISDALTTQDNIFDQHGSYLSDKKDKYTPF